ncbi:MAG: inorganic phosphate transporter, partial [Chloroflexi bacterium]|nr:inorganic phosphate transporter [Chloroflexota bacterium]
RWGVAINIVAAWVLTVPSAFVLGWGIMQLTKLAGLVI